MVTHIIYLQRFHLNSSVKHISKTACVDQEKEEIEVEVFSDESRSVSGEVITSNLVRPGKPGMATTFPIIFSNRLKRIQ
ncbi:hypothetical protein CEXT_114901 [Caerostris extrusa]|uniref:Uncharacterized protein n=1 Tax=Caerostris extrusa TaxID=172846 RepID=A0AAV4SNI3_CAEEX|nr:hypothetical protein CEXT_114901 [Caerostris extrusa]